MIYYRQESFDIVGAAMHVYNTLGHGFLEAVYQEALEIELTKRGIPFESQKELRIVYEGQEWRWQWSPTYKFYYVVDLNIECPNCKEGILNVELLGYRCAKCNFEYPSVCINVDTAGVKKQILEDARTKYSYCQEYIGKLPATAIVRS